MLAKIFSEVDSTVDGIKEFSCNSQSAENCFENAWNDWGDYCNWNHWDNCQWSNWDNCNW